MVKRPEQNLWSSYGANGWGDQSWLTPHAEYLNLGDTEAQRLQTYRHLFQSQVIEEDLDRIRKAAHYSQPLGSERFRRVIEQKFGLKPRN